MRTPAGAPVTPQTVARHRRAAERAIETMYERLDESLPLHELAQTAYMSPFHFLRSFHHVMGVPPARFLSALRLEAAMELLRGTDQRIVDVCHSVGFSSIGSFTRGFKQATGLSPKEYREKWVEAKDEREVLAQALEMARREVPGQEPAAVEGTVTACERIEGPVFIGLFPQRLPKSSPVACIVREGAGKFWLRRVPDGEYYLFAVAASAAADHPFAPEAMLRAEAQPSPVRVRGGRVARVSCQLRPRSPVDPPILTVLPSLLRAASRGRGGSAGMPTSAPVAGAP